MKIFAFSLISILLTFQLIYSNAATIKCNCAGDANDSASSSTSVQSQQTTKEKSSSLSSVGNSNIDATSLLTTEIPTHVISNATEASDVKKFIQTVQNSLEKAKPWVEEIEKEAKRLEATAKRFGEGVIHRLGDLMDRIIGSDGAAASNGVSFLTRIMSAAGAGGGGVGGVVTGNFDDEAIATVTENAAPSISIHGNTETINHVTDHNKNEKVVTENLSAAANAAHAAANAAQAAAAIIDETIENEIITDDDDIMQEIVKCPDGYLADVKESC